MPLFPCPEEEFASTFLLRAGEERQRRLARDADMNEAQLDAARLHRAGKERQRRISRDVAMNEAQLYATRLHRACEDKNRWESILMAIH